MFFTFLASPIVSLVISIFFGIVSILFFLKTHKKIFNQGKFLQTLSSDKIKIINDTLGSIKEIKIFKFNKFLEKNFFKTSNEYEKFAFRNYLIKMLPRVILEIGAVIGVVILIILYIKFNQNITTLLPFLSLVVISIIRIVRFEFNSECYSYTKNNNAFL